MKTPKHYSVQEVLNFSNVGVTFEFYSTKESKFLVQDLERASTKEIVLTYNENYNPSYTQAILIKEYNAKKSRYKLVLAPQSYHSIVSLISQISSWISESAETTYDTQMKINLSFNHRQLDTLYSISLMNPSRLILKFDENFVYQRFPNQKKSPYALSIKKMARVNNYINQYRIFENINSMVSTPQANYYGIDFSYYTQGILECNYIGGKDYAKNISNIKEVLEYFIIKTYQSLNEVEYTEFELNEVKRITNDYNRLQLSYYDPDVFLREFKDIKVFVNLKSSDQILKTYWSSIRNSLFEVIINGGFKKGEFNYDVDVARSQIRNATLQEMYVENMDFVNCKLSGIMEKCSFVNCDIKNSRTISCKFISNNKIFESYLQNVSLNDGNTIDKCYLVNNDEYVNCEIKESVIKYATPGKQMKIDENSTFVVKEQPLPKITDSINIKEIRDYTWIKSLTPHKNQGFANEYRPDKFLKP